MHHVAAELSFELDGDARSVELLPGELWTFGRSPDCSASLAVPALSRVALIVQHVEQSVVRVVSRQSNRGRVLVDSDDRVEQHVLSLGSGPVHLSAGNYTIKVEVPPVVLRLAVAVPPPRREVGTLRRAGAHAHDTTALSWAPHPGEPAEQSWIAVAALAVTLTRYPEQGATRLSDALRTAAGLWCGHSSTYWVNARLKEAVDAADLEVPDGGERLQVVVKHYERFFSEATVRVVRDELERLRRGPSTSQAGDT